MRLNVGCGADLWGDVRLDVSRDYWMAKGRSTANILADAQYLPFKDKCFDELKAHEVLEHVPNWKKALRECCRVAKKLFITVPVDSYLPRYDWLFIFLPTPEYLGFLLRLPQRTREHLWQFNIHVVEKTIKQNGFSNVLVDVIYYPIFGFLAYGRKGKYFSFLKERFRKARSWKIIAF